MPYCLLPLLMLQPQELLGFENRVPFDQYEVAVPLSTAADCWASLLSWLYAGLDGQTRLDGGGRG